MDSLKVLSSAPGLATHRLSNWGKWLDVQGPLSPLSKERIIILSPGSCQDNGDNVGKALDLCTTNGIWSSQMCFMLLNHFMLFFFGLLPGLSGITEISPWVRLLPQPLQKSFLANHRS